MMRTMRLLPAFLGSAALLTGCMDYTLETTLRPDGTGVRIERMELTRNDDLELTEAQVLALTRSGPDEGWTSTVDVSADGDTTWIQERRREVASPTAWSDPDHEVLLLGAVPERADDRLGYLRLGDVRLRSSIQVRTTHRSDGSSVVSYREAFVWDGAADAVVEFLLQNVDRRLAERYPGLGERERGEILGFVRARTWEAGEEGLFFAEDTDEVLMAAIEAMVDHAHRAVATHRPGTERGEVAELLTDAFAFDDEQSSRLFVELLPGLNLAFNTDVVVRVTMPGTVSDTNADTRDGSVLEWEFSPLDDLRGPAELYAEAVVGG